MKKIFVVTTLLFSASLIAQIQPYRKRQQPKQISWPHAPKHNTKSDATKCLEVLNSIIDKGETKDYFKPDSSTAIQESYLVLWNGEYYAIIVFTSSNKPYLYWTSISNWNNYISAGEYSAGKSFNEYIYPNKLCDY